MAVSAFIGGATAFSGKDILHRIPHTSPVSPKPIASAIPAFELPASAYLPSTLSLGLGPTERVLQ
jgi:hypothetical protein